MLYLDANFLVLCYFDQTEKGGKARKLLQAITEGKLAVTSALTLDEVMWVMLKNRKAEVLRAVIERIYAIPNLAIKEVGADIPLYALDLMEKSGLKPRDAFHAAVMKKFGVAEIASDDSDFDRVKGVKRIKS